MDNDQIKKDRADDASCCESKDSGRDHDHADECDCGCEHGGNGEGMHSNSEGACGCHNSLAHKTSRLGMLMHRYYAVTARANGHVGDPIRGQGRVLALLKAKPQTSQRELSYLLDMRPQSLSELLGKLEGKGYVTRSKSAEDARVTLVTLTDAGAAAAPDFDANSEAGGPLAVLSPEERETFERCVDKITEELEGRLTAMGVDTHGHPHRRHHDHDECECPERRHPEWRDEREDECECHGHERDEYGEHCHEYGHDHGEHGRYGYGHHGHQGERCYCRRDDCCCHGEHEWGYRHGCYGGHEHRYGYRYRGDCCC